MKEDFKRPLKVFLSYASQDRPVVRELSRRLANEGWIDPWVDEKKLLPGQDWRAKIEEAVETSDIVIICLSSNSVTKEGFVQKELRYAREIAFEKPDETIFLVPLRLDDCTIPRGLRFYQWGDYFGEKQEETYNALLESLKLRYEQKLKIEEKERARREKERQERDAAERIAREKAEREATEKAAREKAEREVAEKAKRERAEQENAERIAREKVKREAAEKAKREKIERQAARRAAVAETLSKLFVSIKSVLIQAKPFFRVLGFIGIVLVLAWAGSWAVPRFVSLVPTPKITSTQHPIVQIATTDSRIPPTQTLIPSETPQSSLTPVGLSILTVTPLLTPGLGLTPTPIWLVIGNWSIEYRFGCTGNTYQSTWYVQPNNILHTSSGDPGSWVNYGHYVEILISTVHYIGIISGDTIKNGTMSGGVQGCWSAQRIK